MDSWIYTDPGIYVISKENCKFCRYTKVFLRDRRLEYTEEMLDPESKDYGARRTALINATNHSTFPWIFIGKTFIGGYNDLLHAYNTFRLHDLLKQIGMGDILQEDF